MTEIVRMTTQMQPLEVGVPLYPFSHAGVFSKETMPTDGTGAPLPDSTQYESTSDSPTAMTGLVGSMSTNSASSPTAPSLSSWATPAVHSISYGHGGPYQ